MIINAISFEDGFTPFSYNACNQFNSLLDDKLFRTIQIESNSRQHVKCGSNIKNKYF